MIWTIITVLCTVFAVLYVSMLASMAVVWHRCRADNFDEADSFIQKGTALLILMLFMLTFMIFKAYLGLGVLAHAIPCVGVSTLFLLLILAVAQIIHSNIRMLTDRATIGTDIQAKLPEQKKQVS